MLQVHHRRHKNSAESSELQKFRFPFSAFFIVYNHNSSTRTGSYETSLGNMKSERGHLQEAGKRGGWVGGRGGRRNRRIRGCLQKRRERTRKGHGGSQSQERKKTTAETKKRRKGTITETKNSRAGNLTGRNNDKCKVRVRIVSTIARPAIIVAARLRRRSRVTNY